MWTVDERRAYMNERYAAQRGEAIYYLGGRCNRCESTENLEIDHMCRKDKVHAVGRLWPARDLHVLFEELEKCQLLCRACHVDKTADETRGEERGFMHGGYYGWQVKRCRCPECVTGRRAWYDARNARRRAAYIPHGKVRGPYKRRAAPC